MSLIVAALIEILTVACTLGIGLAGNMRTTGSTSDDTRSAITVFTCGTIVAGLVAASHFVGW